MLYPGNAPFLGRPPSIMHYGADYTFGDKKAYFNKMSHQQLRLETCPNFLFDEPWDGTVLAHSAQLSKQDALSTEHLATLNAAFCRFYARIGCSPLPERCGGSAASAFVVQRVHWLPPLLHWAASPSGDWRRGGSFGLAWHGWVAWSVCLLLASPRSDRRRTSTPSSPRSRTVVSGHVDGPSPPLPTHPRSRCPVPPLRAAFLGLSGPSSGMPHLVKSSTQVTRRRCAQAGRGWASAAKTRYSCIAARTQGGLISPGPSRTRPRPEAALGSAVTAELVLLPGRAPAP